MIPISQARHRPRRGAEPSSTSSAPACWRWASGRPSFEAAWASYCGVRHAVFMTNGTVALEALLRALDIGPGDEVDHGQLHVQRDGERHPAGRRAAGLRRHPRRRLLHGSGAGRGGDHAAHEGDHAGPPVRPDGRHGAARARSPQRHGLAIIEDAAQAHGASYAGRRAGQFGPAMFSLYATKNLMTGEGGFATTDDDAVADRLRLYPQPRHARPLPPRGAGDELQADGHRGGARAGAARPTSTSGPPGDSATPRACGEGLTDYLDARRVPEGREHVWHQYTMRFPGERQRGHRGPHRTRHRARLVYYPVPVHRQAYLQSFVPGAEDLDLPVTNRLSDEVLSIPVRPNLTDGRARGRRSGPCARSRRRATASPPPRVVPMTAPLRVGLAGLGAMGRNHLRHLSSRDGAHPRRRRRSRRRPARRRRRQVGRRRVRRRAGDDQRGGARRGGHRDPDDGARARSGWPRSSVACRCSIEKPLAGSVAEGIELVAAARRRGVPLQVGHVERFNPAVLELGRRITSGWLGTIYSITSRRAGPFPARIRDVGVTIDLATHDADILSWIAGERPTRVYAELAQRTARRATRTCCSGSSTTRRARPACSTSTG